MNRERIYQDEFDTHIIKQCYEILKINNFDKLTEANITTLNICNLEFIDKET